MSLKGVTEDEFIKKIVVEYRNLTSLEADTKRPLLFGTGQFNVLLEALARVTYRELKELEK